MQLVRIAVVLIGIWIIAGTVGSAIRTVVLPRGVPSTIARFVFLGTRSVFRLRVGHRSSFARRDRIMASYAPTSLILLVSVWEALVLAGYTLIYWATAKLSLAEAFVTSGSSLLTLGTVNPRGTAHAAVMFSEAGIGLLLLALLITFLPSLYAAFARREAMVALLEVRAGSPPSGIENLLRFHRIHGLERLKEQWPRWEKWFADIEESHTSFTALAFFRSPQPHHSWVNAAGAVLDAAALRASTLEGPREPEAELCLRAGYLALRRISGLFGIPYDPDPSPTDPISIVREEFDATYDTLSAAGLSVKADRDQAWADFAGWRVNYDKVLLALAVLTLAPEAPWISDRRDRYWRAKGPAGAVLVPVDGTDPPPARSRAAR